MLMMNGPGFMLPKQSMLDNMNYSDSHNMMDNSWRVGQPSLSYVYTPSPIKIDFDIAKQIKLELDFSEKMRQRTLQEITLSSGSLKINARVTCPYDVFKPCGSCWKHNLCY